MIRILGAIVLGGGFLFLMGMFLYFTWSVDRDERSKVEAKAEKKLRKKQKHSKKLRESYA